MSVTEQNTRTKGFECSGRTRIDQWKKRLLDLSQRNRLLNFKDTNKTVPLLCPDIAGLEDALAAGDVFTFSFKPPVKSDDDHRSALVHQQGTEEDRQQEYLKKELLSKRLQTGLTEFELNKRLLETYRAARTAQEEGGANVCYLALGFLEWTQPDHADVVYSAPLLLLPVELSRKSIQQGFCLKEHDDESLINITLLQMLKTVFNLSILGLDPLPRDHSGIDVPAVLHIFRTAIQDIKGWEVKNTVHLGLFSFTKYLMWKDLQDRTDDLMKNGIISHLLNIPGVPNPFEGKTPSPDHMDQNFPPTRMYCPLNADSSQLACVVAASGGKSFVMEGPPGTGKSQTITNIIAQSLAEGKTVLFVAEKLTALSVVHEKLSDIGLAPYCLELHSNKANKANVLSQFEQVASRLSSEIETEWNTIGNDLQRQRTDLNKYVEMLHRTFPNGLNVFSATATLITLREIPSLPLSWPSVDIHSQEDIQHLKSAVEELSTTANENGSISENPWFGFEHSEWSPSWTQKLESKIVSLETTIQKLEESLSQLSPRLGFMPTGHTLQSLRRINALANVMLCSPGAPKSILDVSDWDNFRQTVFHVVRIGRQRDNIRFKLFAEYSTEIVSVNIGDVIKKWKSATKIFWPFSWLRRRNVRTVLKAFHKDRKIPNIRDVEKILSDVLSLQELQNQIAAAHSSIGTVLNKFWLSGDADWDEVERVCEWVHSFRQAVFSTSDGDSAKMSSMYRQLCDLITLANDQLMRGGQIGNEILTFVGSLAEFDDARHAISKVGNVNEKIVWVNESGVDLITHMKRLISQWRLATGSLRDWCAWQSARSAVISLGLAPLADAVESGIVKAEELPLVFKKSYYQWWLNMLTDQEPLLRQFMRSKHENKIKRFIETDLAFMQKTKNVIAAKLSSNRPDVFSANAAGTSEMGLLKRELQKKKRHIPVRALLAKIPNLLPRLKPCLLMSPLSVAQYLDAGQQSFDIVIFDEASQIPTWDAVGVIARGKQVVITGDPKQLPPTNFFVKAQEEEEFSDENIQVEDLESILDECMSTGMPVMRLNWHYRSRHESLIAFSNDHYYKTLHTFPSAVTTDNAVSFRHVPSGIYDKGKSRTNREEARAVVSEVIDRLSNPATSNQTIGIVTFSQAQQTLIDDMLEKERLLHPEIEKHFSQDAKEPVFIHNLENVQGHERDVIIFSICYGRNDNGKLSQHFGPMNRDGGERRLNVAITRARDAVLVFSSITADEIDIQNTQARGVKDLKEFLDYAQSGRKTLGPAHPQNTKDDFDFLFEQQVHDVLKQRGWQLATQVGCSGYRIDIGVVDKRSPDRYLAGVECDGANYRSAKSARDRDRLRQSILKGLGWRLIRIWSSDWWHDPQREIERVEALLQELLQDERRDTPKKKNVGREGENNTTATSSTPFEEFPHHGSEIFPGIKNNVLLQSTRGNDDNREKEQSKSAHSKSSTQVLTHEAIQLLLRKKLSELSSEEFLNLQKNFPTDEEIGDHFGVTRQAVHQMRKKLGIDSIRGNVGERDMCIRLDYSNGTSAPDLCKKYSLSQSQVYRILREDK